MARTTLDIDASVLAQLRRRARAEHKSMGQLASERLAVSLVDRRAAQTRPPRWPTWSMGKPKLDLGDKEALRRALDARYAGVLSVTVDTNVLLYASNGDDPLHERAKGLLDATGERPRSALPVLAHDHGLPPHRDASGDFPDARFARAGDGRDHSPAGASDRADGGRGGRLLGDLPRDRGRATRAETTCPTPVLRR